MYKKRSSRFIIFILLCVVFYTTSAQAQGRFRVTLNGFVANRQTNEGIDGGREGDEISLRPIVNTVDRTGGQSPSQNPLLSPVLIFGPVLERECHPAAFPCGRGNLPVPVTAGRPLPIILFEDIIPADKVIAIIPSIWEQDGFVDADLWGHYSSAMLSYPSISAKAISIIEQPPPLELSKFLMRMDHPDDLVPLAGHVPQDRPIGMLGAGINRFDFSPWVLFLTSRAADFISNAELERNPRGVIKINYRDADFMGGDYTLFLQVSPCKADITSIFRGEMSVTVSNLPYRIVRPFNMTLKFTDCRTKVQIVSFDTIVSDPYNVDLPGGGTARNTTTVTRLPSAPRGTYDDRTGSMEIPLLLFLRHSLSSQYPGSGLSLTVSTRGGISLNPQNGQVELTGTEHLEGGAPLGTLGIIRITGTLSPRPSDP
jgi:hypothetical protein